MNLSHYFIDRPIFASVLSVLIVLAGGITFYLLPISQYPDVVPPTVVVSASYPGATAETVAETVATPIEQQVNGVSGMLYMSSQSSNNGSMTLTVTFALGTNPDLDQVLVQNQIASALPSLPESVRQIGVTAQKSSPNFLLLINLISPDGKYDSEYLSNYAEIQLQDSLKRVPGVGNVQLFGARQYSMRIWLDPARMAGYRTTVEDVQQAVRSQNVQVAAGSIGGPPAPLGNQFDLTVNTLGRLKSPEQFAQIIIKTGSNGQIVRLHDVGRAVLGAKDYAVTSYHDGQPTVALGVSLDSGSNAVATATLVHRKMEELGRRFNPGLAYRIDYDTSVFVLESLKEVEHTLFIAILLVVFVVILFLQTWRAAIIPLVAIPVSLIGTFAVLYWFGFSLNNLSLFGLVLAIGIVVDDAIVVVENCERHLSAGLLPREAARRAMDEVAGPVIAIAVVLTAVFLPSAFLPGISGEFYRQFAVTVAVSTVISAFNSLTLSPALCGVLLRGQDAPKDVATRLFDRGCGWFLVRFNRAFGRASDAYATLVRRILRFAVVSLILYVGLLILTGLAFNSVPSGFVPTQDQGYLIMAAQLPDSASLERTEAVRRQITKLVQDVPGVAHSIAICGFSVVTGSAQSNALTIFITLKPFHERKGPDESMNEVVRAINQRTALIQAADVATFAPPPVSGIGATGGFQMELEDRGNLGLAEMQAVSEQLTAAANRQPVLTQVYSPIRTNVPQLYVEVDRTKVQRLGVPLQDVFNAMQTYLGASYINDFNFLGRTYQVNAQAEADYRAFQDQIGRLYTRNREGKMVPLSAVTSVSNVTGPDRVTHYNLFTAADVFGTARAGMSSGQAIQAMQKVCAQTLPAQMSYEWTGLTYQEIQAGNTAILIFPLSVFVVFLALAALYESWSLPLAVIFIVPLCLSAAIVGVILRGSENNIFTQIGFIVLVGLACKNAILIVEFARSEWQSGKTPIDAAVEACRIRMRPVLMTSCAFILGVFPLAIATGAGAEMRQALGTAVFSGMIGVTIFGLLLTPVFFVLFIRSQAGRTTPESDKISESHLSL
ncbi:MAG: multidrug efflux RND transporter permease subunit [Verrucomicrobia bacterium]|nr:multidrug efflux RND transporter permease subunit [Verrucomicrobiota bacterium]